MIFLAHITKNKYFANLNTSLSQLYRNHNQDKESYNALIFEDVNECHEIIDAAFSKDNLPDQYSKQFEADINCMIKNGRCLAAKTISPALYLYPSIYHGLCRYL